MNRFLTVYGETPSDDWGLLVFAEAASAKKSEIQRLFLPYTICKLFVLHFDIVKKEKHAHAPHKKKQNTAYMQAIKTAGSQ